VSSILNVYANGTWINKKGTTVTDTPIDISSFAQYITLANFDDYLYTTPFGTARYGALMKRQKHVIDLNFGGLLAGIDVWVYLLLIAALACMLFIGWVNEHKLGDYDPDR
jgi:hypothetical protein